MDEAEFRRLLLLFPVVRSPDYHAESEQSKESTSKSADSQTVKEWQDAWNEGENKDMEKETLDVHEAFWEKLRLVAEKKVGATEAEKFCKAFQLVHKKLVYEELSLDAAKTFLNST